MASAIPELIARKNFPKALEVIKAELQKRPHEVRLKIQQVDVLVMAGRNKEAIPVLMALADEHASDGFTAKAIAFLKRIDKLEPGRRDVEERLSHLAQEKARHAPVAQQRPAAGLPEFGFEEIGSAPEFEMGVGSVEPEITPDFSPEFTPDITPDSLPDSLPDADMPSPPLGGKPTSATQQARSFLQTPLFEGFSQDELAAILRGLKFLSFEPGDVLVGEGAPGDSMFIIASGTVKAYVRDPKGAYLKVKELGEGEFFGEISVITGKPRTATITAAGEVEVLELDKATLDSITHGHPHIRQVLADYQNKRAMDTVSAIIRGRD
jgi:CRP/FNR family transcriptional regulator, cyclic AMP receptor protein